MTRRITRVSVLLQNQLVLARIERADINAVALIPCVSSRNSGAIEEVAAVGEEVRVVLHLLLARLVQRQGGGLPPPPPGPVKCADGFGGGHDHPLAGPRPAPANQRVAKRLRVVTPGVYRLS